MLMADTRKLSKNFVRLNLIIITIIIIIIIIIIFNTYIALFL